MTAQIHVVADLRPHDFPGGSLLQPLVGHPDLRSVMQLLIEDAEFVTDA